MSRRFTGEWLVRVTPLLLEELRRDAGGFAEIHHLTAHPQGVEIVGNLLGRAKPFALCIPFEWPEYGDDHWSLSNWLSSILSREPLWR